MKNYVRIVTQKGNHVILDTMNHAEHILPKTKFCRIHRQFIVALESVIKFNHDKVYLKGEALPLSEQYRKAFYDCFLTLGMDSKSKGSPGNGDSNEIFNNPGQIKSG